MNFVRLTWKREPELARELHALCLAFQGYHEATNAYLKLSLATSARDDNAATEALEMARMTMVDAAGSLARHAIDLGFELAEPAEENT